MRAPRPVKGGLRTDKIVNEGFVPRKVEDAIMDFHRQSMQSPQADSQNETH